MFNNGILMENPDLFEKKLSILQEISSIIVVTDNIGAIANLMLDLAISYTNAEKGSLMLVNDRGELSILAARGIDIQLFNTYREKIGEGIAGTIAKNRTPVLVDDIDKDERFQSHKRDHYKTKSFISCPVVSRDRLLGVLNINDKRSGNSFTEDEFTLLKVIANQAAIALENAFLMTQLRAKATELEEINRKLIESDVVKTEFITRVSHELRTPLNSIKGAIYYLHQRDQQQPPDVKEFYTIIDKETGKLISIVEGQLDFLRLEDETQVMKKAVISLPELLRDVAASKFLETLLAQRNLHLRLNLHEALSDIVGDKIRVFQFFVNLIEGLSHYLQSGDEIVITGHENDVVSVSLRLSRRLPENAIPFIADPKPLFHLDKEEEKLKLYLARKVAESHRWRLEVENLEDAFVISLAIPKIARQKIEAVIDTTMGMFIDFVAELLNLNICSIMLADEYTGDLSIKGARGLDDDVVKRTRIRVGDNIAGWVAMEGKPLLIEDIESDHRFTRRSIAQYNTKSLLSLPLKIDDRIVGVINLNNKRSGTSFTKQDLVIASVLSERISHFLKKLYAGEYMEDEFKDFIASLDSLLGAEKRYYKKGDVLPALMRRLMEALGASEEETRLALYVSSIYDLGLMLVDERVLSEKKLQASEISTIRVHPHTTVGLLNNFEFSEDVKKAILHHHEHFDGTGYPDRLKGENIPFLSRVLAVTDAFCAMTSPRPYRKALSREASLQEIKKGSGKFYDPEVVGALERVLPDFIFPDA